MQWVLRQEELLQNLQSGSITTYWEMILFLWVFYLLKNLIKFLKYDYYNYMSPSILWIIWLYVLIIFTCWNDLWNGSEGQISTLYENLIASHDKKVMGSSLKPVNKGTRELNRLFCSVNYEAHSGSSSSGRRKGRVYNSVLWSPKSFLGMLKG